MDSLEHIIESWSIRTIAKVGGLVGKTQTRFVRVRIACRDIYEVPDSAEGNLGLNIFDFFYELEEPLAPPTRWKPIY